MYRWKKDLQSLPLIFENTLLTYLEQHKHLCVILQNKCKWDEHIKCNVTKGHILLAYLYSFKSRLSMKSLENTYKASIVPHFY